MKHQIYNYRYERQMIYRYLLHKYPGELVMEHTGMLIPILDKMLPPDNSPSPCPAKINKLVKLAESL